MKLSEGRLLALMLSGVLLATGGLLLLRRPAAKTYAPVHEMHVEIPLVNINEADAQELTQLPGIGESLAEAIVAEREENGDFESAEDLLRVNGIGQGKLEKLAESVCVEDETGEANEAGETP